MTDPRHFSHCTGCGGTFTCPDCGTVCGKCFEVTEPDEGCFDARVDDQYQRGICSWCAYVEDEQEREQLRDEEEQFRAADEDWS